ncbi:MarR family winged helix-turn-helix transcriptional regulator [Aurantimonas sp. VKM B-3413]|uniref:MarR family winged helix-turn-helix transcriptional regulator n=1 Tax=Aurantimonas sp. VKM B-3413 TaxID=2779401 RepID=UPI001E3D81D2|nr:MarR family transcriptional regulator [Aurantimonas sp. VKM B-3413]MCB8836798.1 MarR family transcriptional regulator [Aurantimonas sp. VKM B-3413]
MTVDRSQSRSTVTRVEDVDLGILDETLSFFIRSLNLAVTRDLDARLEGLDVARGTGKVTALFLIGRHPGIRPSLVAAAAMKDRSAMARVFDDMERHGLIRREADESDGRVQALFLTDKGEKLSDDVREIVRQSRDFFHDISDEEYAQVIDLLRGIYWRIVKSNEGRG